MQVSRRDMLKLAGLGAAGAAGLTIPFGREVSGATLSLLPSSAMPKPYQKAFWQPPVAKPYATKTDPLDGKPVEFYNIYARQGAAQITADPNRKTTVLGYALEDQGPTVPGPTIRVARGTKIMMAMHNELPAIHPTFKTELKLSTHLHGSASLPQYDGYANDSSASMTTKYYHYPNHQEARTLWYHDHGVHYTAQNAYSGLAAQYIVSDADEKRLLPQGEYDVPVTISDIAFKADGSQLYDDRSESGLWGDVILVNGVAWPVMKVKPQIYRFRFLNASVSRSYRPTTSPQVPMHVVATDGGLVEKPIPVTQWRHGNAERYEVLVDFRGMRGKTVYLNNLSNPNNRDFDNTNKIMKFEVADQPTDAGAYTMPTLLRRSAVMDFTSTSTTKVRRIEIDRSNGQWVLNDKTWHDVEASGFKTVLGNPALGATEIWELENSSGGWFHPMHIHLVDFKILSRNGRPPRPEENGPKDVVYMGEGETVRLLMKFSYPGGPEGRYMIHCHNLTHEDHDMMTQFEVGSGGPDPVTAAPPKALPAPPL